MATGCGGAPPSALASALTAVSPGYDLRYYANGLELEDSVPPLWSTTQHTLPSVCTSLPCTATVSEQQPHHSTLTELTDTPLDALLAKLPLKSAVSTSPAPGATSPSRSPATSPQPVRRGMPGSGSRCKPTVPIRPGTYVPPRHPDDPFEAHTLPNKPLRETPVPGPIEGNTVTTDNNNTHVLASADATAATAGGAAVTTTIPSGSGALYVGSTQLNPTQQKQREIEDMERRIQQHLKESVDHNHKPNTDTDTDTPLPTPHTQPQQHETNEPVAARTGSHTQKTLPRDATHGSGVMVALGGPSSARRASVPLVCPVARRISALVTATNHRRSLEHAWSDDTQELPFMISKR